MKKKLLALIIALVTLVTSFAVISLAAGNTDAVADQIVLSFGKDETERNLAWFSEKSTAGEVRLAEASKVVGGVFPTEYKAFSVTSNESAVESGKYSKKATLTGLSENTRYAYVFAVGNELSKIYYFDVGSFGNFEFVYIADAQLQQTSQATLWNDALSKITGNLGADLLISGGDQVTSADDRSLYNVFITDELSGITFAPTNGPNHDSAGSLYAEHYNLPNLSSNYGKSSTTSNYWFVYNNVLFINLNSEDTGDFSNGGHKKFIEEAKAARPDVDWTIVVTHFSFFSTGKHSGGYIGQYRDALAEDLTALGVDLVLSGHDHVYTRSKMMDGLTPATDNLIIDDTVYSPHGTLYVCSNSCTGTKYYDQAVFDADFVAKDSYNRTTAVKFEVTETTLSMKSYHLDDMTVFDSFIIDKNLPATADIDTELEGVDVTLTDGVLLNFYVSSTNLFHGIDNAQLVTKNGKQCYKITVEVAAKEMGDDITVQLKSGDTLIGNAFTLSVKEYAQGILNGNYDAVTKAMTQALLNYGAAAQNYFGYKTDTLVGTPVTDISKLAGATVEGESVTDSANVFVGASLVLEGTMKLRFYFNGNDLSVTVDGNAVKAENKDECCYVDVRVFPNDIDKIFEVKCGSATIKYSVLNYLKNNADDAELAEMVASIYEYSVVAKSYLVDHCTHEDAEYKITRLPTLFSKGVKKGECDSCHEEIRIVLNETVPKSAIFNENVGDKHTEKLNIKTDVLGDKHFYPTVDDPNGNDLFIELSLLWNETLANNANAAGAYYLYLGMLCDSSGDSSGGRKTPYHLLLVDNIGSKMWCQYAGGFESDNNTQIIYGPSIPDGLKVNATEADYPMIGDYGWHRIGVQLHQTSKIVSGSVKHDIIATLYVDGVKLSAYKVIYDADNSNKNLLYTAKVENGEIVYTGDVADDRYVFPYMLGDKRSKPGTETYFSVADVFVTAGDEFVIDIEKVEKPEDATFEVAPGKTTDGTVHFQVVAD